jgi:hypothetical protein
MTLSGTPSWASSTGVRVAQLVGREAPPDAGFGGESPQLRAGSVG